MLNARDAKNYGASIKTHTSCIDLMHHKSSWSALLEDCKTGDQQKVVAKAVVNATGPWVDKTMNLFSKKLTGRSIRLVKGSHIIEKIFDHDYPYFFQLDDGRILFAIPFENNFTML